jgi:hypothetical protein
MAIFGASNQLLQIDTGATRTYLFNKALSPIQVYANIGEVQTLGQRYFGVTNTTPVNPAGAPAIFQLAQYLSTSALTTANLTTFGGPVPVWWTDETFTTVSAISTEGLSLNTPAGYLMVNIISLPTLTAAQLFGAQVLVQVAGFLKGAYGPTSGTAGIGNFIEPVAGTGTSQGVVLGTAPGYNKFGTQLTAVTAGLCDVLVDADII